MSHARPEILNKLKAATQHLHDHLESISYTSHIMGGTLTLEQYRHLILTNYYFHLSFEQKIDDVLTAEQKEELNWEKRKKASILRSDLEAIGTSEFLLDRNPFPAQEVTSIEEALGAMYVTEGSTLGGAVILKQLKQNENLKSVPSMTFYGCYGDQIGPMWMAFAQVAAKYANSPAAEASIVKAGVDTFENFAACTEQTAGLVAA